MRDWFAWLFVVLFLIAVFVFGYSCGFHHVIMNSEAYAIEGGDILVLEIDGEAYEYVVSPQFYSQFERYNYVDR